MAAASRPFPQSCDKKNHFINCGPEWRGLTINPTSALKVPLFYHPGLFLLRTHVTPANGIMLQKLNKHATNTTNLWGIIRNIYEAFPG